MKNWHEDSELESRRHEAGTDASEREYEMTPDSESSLCKKPDAVESDVLPQ